MEAEIGKVAQEVAVVDHDAGLAQRQRLAVMLNQVLLNQFVDDLAPGVQLSVRQIVERIDARLGQDSQQRRRHVVAVDQIDLPIFVTDPAIDDPARRIAAPAVKPGQPDDNTSVVEKIGLEGCAGMRRIHRAVLADGRTGGSGFAQVDAGRPEQQRPGGQHPDQRPEFGVRHLGRESHHQGIVAAGHQLGGQNPAIRRICRIERPPPVQAPPAGITVNRPTGCTRLLRQGRPAKAEAENGQATCALIASLKNH